MNDLRAPCGHVAATGPRCANPECRHLDVFHDLPRGKQVRTACSHSEGPEAEQCPCKKFEDRRPPGTTSPVPGGRKQEVS